jgi:hypothetical protein
MCAYVFLECFRCTVYVSLYLYDLSHVLQSFWLTMDPGNGLLCKCKKRKNVLLSKLQTTLYNAFWFLSLFSSVCWCMFSVCVFWHVTIVVWSLGTSISKESSASIFYTEVLPKHWYVSTRLHGVTSQKTVILVFSFVRTSRAHTVLCLQVIW